MFEKQQPISTLYNSSYIPMTGWLIMFFRSQTKNISKALINDHWWEVYKYQPWKAGIHTYPHVSAHPLWFKRLLLSLPPFINAAAYIFKNPQDGCRSDSTSPAIPSHEIPYLGWYQSFLNGISMDKFYSSTFTWQKSMETPSIVEP